MDIPRRRLSDKEFSGKLPTRIRHARRIAKLSQAAMANAIGVSAGAIAQWELASGTSPTVAHLISVAELSGLNFEWLATGRGSVSDRSVEVPTIDIRAIAVDELEERLLSVFRRMPSRKRALFVECIERFI